MTPDAVLKEMEGIIAEELGLSSVSLKPETAAGDVKGWDSLMHLQIITALERRFAVRFGSSQILNFRDVGEMRDAIVAARGKAV